MGAAQQPEVSMFNRIVFGTIAALSLSACAASTSEINRARTARYTCDREAVIAAAAAVVEREYRALDVVDRGAGVVRAEWHWRTREGAKRPMTRPRRDGDVGFTVEVSIEEHSGAFLVRPEPKVTDQTPGSLHGRRLTRQDANWPMWADARADTIAVRVREALADCAIDANLAARGPRD
jgi:hypothetical protein